MKTAPSLPFRGIIGYFGRHALRSVEEPYPLPGFGLQYWNSVDTSLTYVSFGREHIICPSGGIFSDRDGIEASYLDYLPNDWVWEYGQTRDIPWSYHSHQLVVIEVPWGDEAYPSFLFPPYRLNPGVAAVKVGGDLTIQRITESYTGSFRILIDEEVRSYGLYPNGLGPEYQKLSDADIRYIEEREPSVNWDAYLPWDLLTGTDGRNYGIVRSFYEPACSDTLAFVYAGDTGELLICGWTYFGPVLVNLDQAYEGITDPVFPVIDPPVSEDSCDRIFDLRDLRANATDGPEASP